MGRTLDEKDTLPFAAFGDGCIVERCTPGDLHDQHRGYTINIEGETAAGTRGSCSALTARFTPQHSASAHSAAREPPLACRKIEEGVHATVGRVCGDIT